MKQELRRTFEALGQNTEAVTSFMLPQATEAEITFMPLRRGRGDHFSPVALVKRNPSELKVRSDQLTCRILMGLLDEQKFIITPESQRAEYSQTLSKSGGYVNIVLSPRCQESRDCVRASLDVLGDELVDTFLALLAVALDTNGTQHVTLPFTITPDDILSIRQKKKSKGSYSAHQRQKVIEQVQTLAQASVCATIPLYRAQLRQIESPLLELISTDQPSRWNTYADTWHSQPWYLKIGDWASMVPESQYQTAVMAGQVLGYHSKKQKHEKRLGRYITLLYRINAYKHAGKVKVSMGVLLEQAGITPDLDHPGRTQESIESALEQLRIDGVIGPFTLLLEDSSQGMASRERIKQHAYHWWDDYQRQLWLFDPPEYLHATYQGKPREPAIPD
jgi:hypothetical protein